ncbi:MAG: hypothetical protein JXO51_05920 [Candidatus Aminicenantes bacterium]|nr:hypothetical protein [Candidatus Aminicenantes bacterium]
MKSKIALLLLLAALGGACAEPFLTVTVPFRADRVFDPGAGQHLFYIDFVCDVSEAGIDADAELRRVFSDEVTFAAGRKVVLLEPEHWATVRGLLQRYRLAVDIQYEDSVFFRKVFQAHPRALFFTGKLKLDVRKMGVIKQARDELGNRKNVYETAQLWEMTLKVQVIDGDKAAVLWQDAYTEKMEPWAGTTPQFNFNNLLARIMAKLTAALQPRKELQERYILKK